MKFLSSIEIGLNQAKLTFAIILTVLILIHTYQVKAEIEIVGVVNSNTQLLLEDLRLKTGLNSIAIGENNRITYSRSENAVSGSATMRRQLVGAIEDKLNIFEIHDHSKSGAVHFCKTDAGTVFVDSGSVRYQISFDFSDFVSSRRISSGDAHESFSLGLMLFHEIDHKVSYDPSDPIPPGGIRPDKSDPQTRGVVENTNIVRTELGLITRDSRTSKGERYKGLIRALKNTFQIRFHSSSGRTEYLRWRSNH